MNHNTRQKNFNMSTGHRKAVFNNMVKSFEQNGHLTTTLKKAKQLKSLVEKNDPSVRLVRVGFRKGDNAEMAKLMSGQYHERINKTSKSKKK